MSLDEGTNLVFAHQKLKSKDERIMALEDMLVDYKKQIEVEMLHSDHTSDLNVKLKDENAQLRDRLKVIVLPSALDKLKEMVQVQDLLVRKLRRALVAAMDLIPDTETNKTGKDALKKFYQNIA